MLVGEAYGITIDGNAKSAQKTMTQFQNIFEQDVPKAEEEVRKTDATFKGFEFKTVYTDDGNSKVYVMTTWKMQTLRMRKAASLTLIMKSQGYEHTVNVPGFGSRFAASIMPDKENACCHVSALERSQTF